MVDLATFRTFPRASPAHPPEAPTAERDVPVDTGIVADDALSTRFSQELRARRRAVRTGMRRSEPWAEPESFQPHAAPNAEPDDRKPRKPPRLEAEHVETRLPGAARHWLHPQTSAPSTEYEGGLPHNKRAFFGLGLAAERIEHGEPGDALSVAGEQNPASAPKAAALVPDGDATGSDRRPQNVSGEPVEWSASAAPMIFAEAGARSALSDALETSPEEETWPAEPPSAPADRGMRPIAPPRPLEADKVEAAPADGPLVFSLCESYYSDSPNLDYQLLGLANPLVVTVTGQLGDATPTPLTVGRTGIYRPHGVRTAPWSGFAYDVSPDGRNGLVLGTRILTSRGEIAVEELVPGDTALALRGPALLPIVWIGRSIADPPPIEIDADAFGPGRPRKTLRVGADHPIFVQTMPVSARDLVNGKTIRSLGTETAELFHIDVGFAEVLLADGVPISSGCR